MEWLLIITIIFFDGAKMHISGNTYKTEQACKHDGRALMLDKEIVRLKENAKADVVFSCKINRVNYEL